MSKESQFSEAVRRIAETDCPVLVMGERGAGKRSISELLHTFSSRSADRYKSVPAVDALPGIVASLIAGSGTLVLMETAELPLETQEQLVGRYRSSDSIENNRLICTTRHDLAEAVQDGRMREDFYYFISAVSLRVLPLRHRKGELLMLADDMLTRYAKQYDRPKPLLSSEICSFLMEQPWPQNLAELELSMKTCVAIGDPDFSLAALRAAAPGRGALDGDRHRISLKAATRAACNRVERKLISEDLIATAWNRKQTARNLKISYKTLLFKVKQNGLADGLADPCVRPRP